LSIELEDWLTIVSGIPRSGTSMMMSMLAGGGMEIVSDQKREPDPDNPEGYYEDQRVKRLKQNAAWLETCKDKAIKIVSPLLKSVPDNLQCKIIFMQRDLAEILASQKKMLARRGQSEGALSDEQMAEKFQLHLKRVDNWLSSRKNWDVIEIRYREVIENPYGEARRVNSFLRNRFDIEKMALKVNKRLYRHQAARRIECGIGSGD